MLRTCCAVVGQPVAHSLSPAIHRAAYASLGLDWEYQRIDLDPGGLPGLVAALRAESGVRWRGLSVTMPHKADAARLGKPSELVALTGVANTLVLTPEGITAHNTDVTGFVLALQDRLGAGQTPGPGFSGTIVGNGATALSALVALRRLGADRAQVVCRAAERARGMVELAGRLGVGIEVHTPGDRLAGTEVLISTVPARGSEELAAEVAHVAPVVFDSVYDPWPTPLVEAVGVTDPSTGSGNVGEAGRCGDVQVLDGLDLLAAQAVEQVSLFTGQPVALGLARTAAQDALRAGDED